VHGDYLPVLQAKVPQALILNTIELSVQMSCLQGDVYAKSGLFGFLQFDLTQNECIKDKAHNKSGWRRTCDAPFFYFIFLFLSS
jgi:hypothetical protein